MKTKLLLVKLLVGSLAVSFLAGCQQSTGLASRAKRKAIIDRHARNEALVLRKLSALLAVNRRVGRLYFSGRPAGGSRVQTFPWGTGPALFPSLRLQREHNRVHGLAAVRALFAGDRNVRVKNGGPHLVRVYIGSVSDTALNMRISALRLGRADRYSPDSAILAIEYNRQLCTALQKIGYSFPVAYMDFLSSLPSRNLPSLPPVMEDVTLDQVLDRIARTFNGIVIYSQCDAPNGGHLLWITFVHIHTIPRATRKSHGGTG